MDFLLNPTIAYLFLIGGFFLAMLALAAPGTGLLEITAFFCILLAGYAVSNLSFNWWALVLVVLSIIPFVYALRKLKREPYLVLSILMLIIGSVFIFPPTKGGDSVNPLVAIVTSVLVAGFLWFAVRKSVEAAKVRPSHDLDGLIGQTGEARTKIGDEGSVLVAGELWSAKSDQLIEAGTAIRVVRRDGFMLIVEKNG